MPKKGGGTTVKVTGLSWVFWLVIVGILGWFTYGHSLTGALGAIVIGFISGLAMFVGFVPVAGPFIYWYWAFPYLLYFSLNLTGLSTSWLTDIFMWLGLIVSIILTTIVTVMIVISRK